MIIQSSDLLLKSAHSYEENSSAQERLLFWAGSRPSNSQTGSQPTVPTSSSPALSPQLQEDLLDLSPQALKLTSTSIEEAAESEIGTKDEAKINMVKALLEAFTGRKIKVIHIKGIKDADQEQIIKLRELNLRSQSLNSARAGWGLEYDYSATYQEREKMDFSAAGIVKTADGQEIKVKLDISMSRQFTAQQNIHLRAGDAIAKDPLVINFQAPAAALTERSFHFDLDMDGSEDLISFTGSGSGFLALDKNNDGIINDGSELFGPQTGSGFAELQAYDSDGNGWIDENDPIFNQLRIWTLDESGNKVLLALGQSKVGAIYLGAVNTDFSLKNAGNESQGQLRSSSIFLREDGTAGTIQQIDLVV